MEPEKLEPGARPKPADEGTDGSVHSSDYTCRESTTLRADPVAGHGLESPVGVEARAADPGSTTPRRVLVVDDNVESAKSLAMIIGLWGHDCHVAFSGPDALTTASAYHPDIILLDLGLPGMDGFTVARMLREDLRFRATPLLAMTGYQDADDDQLARDSGIARIFLKPIDLTQLEVELARQAASGGPGF